MRKTDRPLREKNLRRAWFLGSFILLFGGGTPPLSERQDIIYSHLAIFFSLPVAHSQAALVNPKFRRVVITTEKGGQDFAIARVSPNVFVAPAQGDARLELAFTTMVPDRRVGYAVSLYSAPEVGATPVDAATASHPIGPPIMIRAQSSSYGECGVYSVPGKHTCTIRVPRDRFDASGHQWEYVKVDVWSLGKAVSPPVFDCGNCDTVQKFTLKFTRVENRHAIARGMPGQVVPSAPADQSALPTKKPRSAMTSGALAHGIEFGTNRYGGDYASRDLASAKECQSACASEAQCRAWTWVRPGVQGPGAKCWLKDSVPVASTNSCCISGVKR
jgi:PAN domain